MVWFIRYFSRNSLICYFSTGLGPRIIPFSRDIIQLGVQVLRDSFSVTQGGWSSEQGRTINNTGTFQERRRHPLKMPWPFFAQFSIPFQRFGELWNWRAFSGFTMMPWLWGPPAKSAFLRNVWHLRRPRVFFFLHILKPGLRYRALEPG